MSKAKALRITFVQYEGGYSLLIGWINGELKSVSLTEQVLRLRAMRSLRNKAVFAQARTGEGGHSVAWPGGIDMGADRLQEITLAQNGRSHAVPAPSEGRKK